VGALVLAHGDDQGLVLPPALAPIQVVVVPFGKTEEEKGAVRAAIEKLCSAASNKVRIHADLREEVSPGFKFNEWELKGVPLRLEIGPRDLAQGNLVCVSRLDRKKESFPLEGIESRLPEILARIQRSLYERALKFRIDNTRSAKTYAEFKEQLETLGGFFEAFWCGSAECERKIKEETKATIRCIPLEGQGGEGACLYCGSLSRTRVLMARAY
jgi:prolyl-tRNA synthetase